MSLGVNVDRLRLTTLMLATLMASSTIAFTGIIGFIGLNKSLGGYYAKKESKSCYAVLYRGTFHVHFSGMYEGR
jgi:ABC-type enterochelin transport system permease subunit